MLTMTLVVLALTLVLTLRGLSAPLPADCDVLLNRYAAECYLPRRAVEPAPGCGEQLGALYL